MPATGALYAELAVDDSVAGDGDAGDGDGDAAVMLPPPVRTADGELELDDDDDDEMSGTAASTSFVSLPSSTFMFRFREGYATPHTPCE